jgi:hypothetical protein
MGFPYYSQVLVLVDVCVVFLARFLLLQDIGLNEHHQQNVVNYLRFARFNQGQRLRGIEAAFEDLKDSR